MPSRNKTMERISGNRIKSIVRNNLGLKILALLVAVFVWLYVYHIDIKLPQAIKQARPHSTQTR